MELALGEAARIAGDCLREAARTAQLWLPTGFKPASSKPASPKLELAKLGLLKLAPARRASIEPAASAPVIDNDSIELQDGIRALNNLRVDDAIRILMPLVFIDCSESDVGKLSIKCAASNILAVAVHHGLGRLDEGIFWWRENMRLRRLIARNFGDTDTNGLEIYDDFWSVHLGHTAMLGIRAKRHLLDGDVDQKHYLIRPSGPNLGNRYLVEQMGRFFTLVDGHAQLPFQPGFIDASAKSIYIDNRLIGPATYYWQILTEVSRAWEEAGVGPLLAFAADELDSGLKQREAMGVPRNAWHACLHVRASGFKLQHDDLHNALNADISTYDLAIDAVVKRGGWVIRLGDPSMPKLPPLENVIDYAHSPQKSPEMDIFLCGTSRFYIGTSSGPAYVPALYGVPSVVTNWFPTGTRPLNSDDLFIPKLHWYEAENEFAPFDESMSQPLGHIHLMSQFGRRGISLRTNTSEELRDVVEEMLDRLDGTANYTAEDKQLQSYFDAVALHARSYGNAQVGRDFLRKFRNLLPSAMTTA